MSVVFLVGLILRLRTAGQDGISVDLRGVLGKSRQALQAQYPANREGPGFRINGAWMMVRYNGQEPTSVATSVTLTYSTPNANFEPEALLRQYGIYPQGTFKSRFYWGNGNKIDIQPNLNLNAKSWEVSIYDLDDDPLDRVDVQVARTGYDSEAHISLNASSNLGLEFGLPMLSYDANGKPLWAIELFGKSGGPASGVAKLKSGDTVVGTLKLHGSMQKDAWTSLGTFRVPVSPGTEAFAAESLGMRTTLLTLSQSGFDPKRYGWPFANKKASFQTEFWAEHIASFAGLCSGMSSEADKNYVKSQQSSQQLPASVETQRDIVKSYLEFNLSPAQLSARTRLKSYGSDADALRGEANRVSSAALATGMVVLTGNRDLGLISPHDDHCVVVIGSCKSESFVVSQELVGWQMLFAYDPNNPGGVLQMGVSLKSPRFVAPGYDYGFLFLVDGS